MLSFKLSFMLILNIFASFVDKIVATNKYDKANIGHLGLIPLVILQVLDNYHGVAPSPNTFLGVCEN